MATVDNKYRHINLRATTQGIFIREDIQLNGIEDVMQNNFPEFLELFERKLGQKRRLLDDQMCGAVEKLIGAMASKSYFQLEQSVMDPFNPTSDPTIPIVSPIEFSHIAHISSIDGVKLVKTLVKPDEGSRTLFKEADANWLYFNLLAHYLESHPSNLRSDGKAKVVVKQGQEPWPFPLIIRVSNADHTYRPQNDFLILKFGLPRLVVEVNSHSPGEPAADHYRLMLQGASMVRFANTFLDPYKTEKNFVFVAIFIGDTGVADRYLMFQDKNSNKVHRKKRAFEFVLKEHRVEFALELYNLASSLCDENGDKDTKADIDELAANFNNKELPRFTGRTKQSNRKTDPGSSARRSNDDSIQVDQLEACGYKVVPDVFEDDGGTWELLNKLPPHIRTVYRRGDPNKTEYIAKHLRKRSKELTILEYLHTKQPWSPHIIQFIEAVPSTTKEWLILPKLYSICDQTLLNSRGTSGRVQLGFGLIKGLAYLHEHKIAHRDVRPDNLVCDDYLCLQIIDFDVAIKVQDENTEIGEYRGAWGWTAPEMGKEDGPTPMHSPIKADRWSCGRVLLRHIIVGEMAMMNADKPLLKFANRLMANDPQRRPSLLEWCNLVSPCSDVANVVEDGGKEVFQPRQDMAEVDGESIEPPDAKKPRLKH